MEISTNQFTRKSFSKSANTFSDTLAPSANAFTGKGFQKGTSHAWNGSNLTDAPAGAEDLFGGPFSAPGVGEAGGFGHYFNRTGYTITR